MWDPGPLVPTMASSWQKEEEDAEKARGRRELHPTLTWQVGNNRWHGKHPRRDVYHALFYQPLFLWSLQDVLLTHAAPCCHAPYCAFHSSSLEFWSVLSSIACCSWSILRKADWYAWSWYDVKWVKAPANKAKCWCISSACSSVVLLSKAKEKVHHGQSLLINVIQTSKMIWMV